MTPGKHIEASPVNVAEFIHATALSMKQLLADMQLWWGPVEHAEFHELMRQRLALTPEDHELINYCHAIHLAMQQARQNAMQINRFPTGT